MGYSSKFTGELKFTNEPTAKQLAKIKSFLGGDCREHPEWGNTELSYIDLKFNEDFTGLKWSGAEKTYDLEKKVNLLIKNVKKEYPEFGLTGQLLVQGEIASDRWVLAIDNGKAVHRKTAIKGRKVICPNCDEEFILEDAKDKEGASFVFVFTGFRNAEMQEALEAAGHEVLDNVAQKTTHLVAKDITKNSSKRQKAADYGCTVWSIAQLEEFIERQ